MPMMMSQVLKTVNFAKAQKFTYHENEILFILQIEKICITKPCTHLHSAQLISAFTQTTISFQIYQKYDRNMLQKN